MVTRRNLLSSGVAALAGTMATGGETAPGAASLPTLNGADGHLLSLRAELTAAVADAGHWNTVDTIDDDQVVRSGRRLVNACWAIVKAPAAQTDAGRALKAAACMHQLRFSYGPGGWEGDGEAMAWSLLKEMAGDAYAGVEVPDYAQSNMPEGG